MSTRRVAARYVAKQAGTSRLVHFVIRPFKVSRRFFMDDLAWNTAQAGRPSPENIKKFVVVFNKALEPGGPNEHLGIESAIYGGEVFDQFNDNKSVAVWEDKGLLQEYKHRLTHPTDKTAMFMPTRHIKELLAAKYALAGLLTGGTGKSLDKELNSLADTLQSGITRENRNEIVRTSQRVLSRINDIRDQIHKITDVTGEIIDVSKKVE